MLKKFALVLAMICAITACKKQTVKETENGLKMTDKQSTPALTPVSVDRKNVSVWMDASVLDVSSALLSLDANRGRIGEVSPVLFGISEDGKIVQHWEVKNNINRVDSIKYVATKSEPKILVRPTIGNVGFEGANVKRLVTLLSDPKLRNEAMVEIEKIVKDPAYSGVCIDFEGLDKENINLLVSFIEELAPRLHRIKANSLYVALDVWGASEKKDYWKRIGAVADKVQILAYPEHTRATSPGPMSSVAWAEMYLKIALEVIPRVKVVYCAPFFGQVWSRNDDYSTSWLSITNREPGYGDMKFGRDNGGNPTFISSHKGEIWSTAWYEDAYSVNMKVLMAQRRLVDHFAFWQIGDEDPDIWKIFK